MDHCTLFSVLRSVAFNFRCLTKFDKLRMRIGEVVRKIAKKFGSTSMERVEQFQRIKDDHCTLLSVIKSVTFHFRCLTKFHNIRMRIDDVVHKIAQKCEEHIYGES